MTEGGDVTYEGWWNASGYRTSNWMDEQTTRHIVKPAYMRSTRRVAVGRINWSKKITDRDGR